jgi:anaerobic selenocysteine-containing dehydrogenase
MADYVISTSLPYEHDDITGMFDGYNPIAYANVVRGFLKRPPGIIDDWAFFWGLAKRLGLQLHLKRPQYPAAYETVVGPTLALDMERQPEVATILRFYASSFGATDYDELLAAPRGIRRDDLINTVLPAAEQDDGLRLDITPSDVLAELAAVAAEAPNDTFKYRLTTRRMLQTVNSAYSNASRTRKRFPTNPASMNPLDMAAEGLSPNDRIRITSKHGSVIARVEADATLRQGAVSLSHLWGSPRPDIDPEGLTGAFTGHLSSLDETELETINFMPIQSAVPINLSRYEDGATVCSEEDRAPAHVANA